MSPRHFANYAKNNPQEYQSFSDNLWNSFVTVTHTVGLNRFFTFTPDFFEGLEPKDIGQQLGVVYNLSTAEDAQSGHFAQGEIPGDQDK